MAKRSDKLSRLGESQKNTRMSDYSKKRGKRNESDRGKYHLPLFELINSAHARQKAERAEADECACCCIVVPAGLDSNGMAEAAGKATRSCVSSRYCRVG